MMPCRGRVVAGFLHALRGHWRSQESRANERGAFPAGADIIDAGRGANTGEFCC